MLVPPVAPGGTASRQVGDPGVRGPHNSVPGSATTLWPLAPAQNNLPGSQQSQATPPLAATPAPSHNQGINRYELYSLFPGSNGGSYVATTAATPAATPGRTYHATTHKVSESVFSAAVGVGVGGYTWGAPTPPPGSPYSPVPGVTQLELLAKNLASLAPHHAQQPLTLQGVGVNVGASVHHAQHTQHTLNLAGLHHLHHGESMVTSTSTTSFTSKYIDERILTLGGIHQGTFSPQLSLVTAGTPTLTINSFSSPNTQASVMPASGGLLVQEYQPGDQNNHQLAVCPSSSSGSSVPSGTAACTVSTVIVQGAQTGSAFVQSTMKKRESFVTEQAAAQTAIKVENKTTTRQSCICKSTNINNGKTKVVHSEVGCSRTLPVVSSWNGQDTSSCANAFNQSAATNLIKREPLAAVPCQVAEVSTSLHATTTAVKIEPLPPKSENGIVVSTAAASGIPVGIAVARQRLQHHQETSSTSMRNVSLSHHTSHHASYHHFQPDNLGSTTAMAMGGATLIHCGTGGEDRPAHLAIPSGAALAPSLNATLNSGLSNIGPTAPGAWPPTLWQYPTTAMPSLEPVGFPHLGVGLQGGLQLVRDPTSGHLLLIHAAAEQMQQAVVWPNYPSVHSTPNIGAPPLILPGPATPPSLQLLSDINGARLVLTENKRKQQNNVPIVKIEADCATPSATIIASAESSKALQTVTTMTGSLVTDTPLLTTLHYYPHAPALVQISQSESMQCRTQQRNTFISKATSPVSCLTPPPEVVPTHAIETLDNVLNVQDASNQTDAPEPEEDAHHPSSIEIDGLPIKQEQLFSSCQAPASCNFDIVSSSIEQKSKVDKAAVTFLQKDPKIESISSIDQAIDRVVCKSTEDEELVDSAADEAIIKERIRRRPSRVIEITEENCDSFHENLEFFGRRRDPVELCRKPHYSEEMFNQEKLRESSLNDNFDDETDKDKDKDCQQSVTSTLHASEEVNNVEVEKIDPQDSDIVHSSCSPTEKFKSLDMPSIDCDEEDHSLKAKQDCPAIIPDKNHPDKLNRGIENVVEKLKKNAVTLQDNSEKSNEEIVESSNVGVAISTTTPVARCLPRTLTNGLKKHILRFYEEESSILKNVNSKSLTEQDELKKDSGWLVNGNNLSNLCTSTNNNKNNNNNDDDDDSVSDKSEKNQREKIDSESSDESCKLDVKERKKIKTSVDLSGLELLSNSIAQLEHLKPDGADGTSGSEVEASPGKQSTKKGTQENNNNVDSPLGLLCALAEQRFMEEVGDQKRDNGENEKKGEKRRHSVDDIYRNTKKTRKDLFYSFNDKETNKAKKYDYEADDADDDCTDSEGENKINDYNVCELNIKMFKDKTQSFKIDLQGDLKAHDEISTLRLKEPKSHIKLLDNIPSVSPESVLPGKTSEEEDKMAVVVDYDTCSSSPTVRSSSSAKRKVGRPKKLMCTSTSRHLTETIVAKKSRSKSLVSCLISAKNRQSKFKSQSKPKAIKQTPLHSKNVISSILAEKAKLSQEAKIEKQVIKLKPKFKPQKVKDWEEAPEEVSKSEPEIVELVEAQSDGLVVDKEEVHCEKSKKKKRKSISSSPQRRKSSEEKKESKRRKSSECKECKECARAAKAEKVESIANKCKLVSDHLEIDQLRVLTAMGGLFYAGRLSAVQAPDIYAITLDGERGNRPHIHSREEILRDAIVEVCPTSTKELAPGTRLCAYWSQQYRCLYPGTSVESSEPDSDLDEKFVSVEFDDGDSGRIALDDIRLLLPDYPVVEYDPNPLLTLGKKRRLNSMSDDKRSDGSGVAPGEDKVESNGENGKELDEKTMEEYRERKKLKKRRRDKLKRLVQVVDGKKRHKRHKCCEEHRKHKHRKHRKHKHKHNHHSGHNDSHLSGGESCSGVRTEEEHENESGNRNEQDHQNHQGHSVGNGDVANVDLEIDEESQDPQLVVEEMVVEEKSDKCKGKKNKVRERQESVESRSKMAAFLPARQLWGWAGKGYRRPGAKGRAKKQFFKAIQRGTETIQIGDSAVFLSTGRPDRPYIGKIESMWETTSSNMIVKVKWFYHPEETVGCPTNLKYPGALFESPHMDENDVQTISHKCEVLPLQDYTTKLGKEPHRYLTIYDNNDIYYLAGYYDPTTYLLTLQPGVA
ncbi:BAH domain and coiled-coil containing protein winged eye isoform X2 [Cotesia typhae]|uniref:BAH domain and coiled-coil containing protein winged eye isoform X2 n=1 Tax=Cotesia typhae TaxID=2053667 RepID=UPI003D6962A3